MYMMCPAVQYTSRASIDCCRGRTSLDAVSRVPVSISSAEGGSHGSPSHMTTLQAQEAFDETYVGFPRFLVHRSSRGGAASTLCNTMAVSMVRSGGMVERRDALRVLTSLGDTELSVPLP